jgi:hypothetical protein
MPDPWQPGAARWWDGHQWTPYVTPAAPTPNPRADLAAEQGAAVWARRAFVAVGVSRVLYVVTGIVVFNDLIDRLQRAIDTNGRLDNGGSAVQVATAPLSILGVLALVGVIMWTYRAVALARNLGYPMTHTPGWAIAGWLVPIVNFWFPYQVVRDCLPPHHPGRRLVARWWTLYLVTSFGYFIPVVVSIVVSVGIAYAVAAPFVLLIALEAITARQVVDAVTADHERAVHQRLGS